MPSLQLYRKGGRLYAAFLVGRVPNLRFRHAVYRRLGMRIAPGAVVHWRAVFFAPEGVVVGTRSIIGNDCFLDGRKGLTIGTDVNVGGHVHIFTMEHDPHAPDFRATGAPRGDPRPGVRRQPLDRPSRRHDRRGGGRGGRGRRDARRGAVRDRRAASRPR